jgi:hypothetical protein
VLADVAANALMLMVGSRGVLGLATTAFGAVSRYAAVHALCSMVIHRRQAAPVHHRIVLGIRDPGDNEAPLAFAFEEASQRGAHLLALHGLCWSHPAEEKGPAIKSKRVSSEAFLSLTRLLEPWQEKYPDVEVGTEVIHARPGPALAQTPPQPIPWCWVGIAAISSARTRLSDRPLTRCSSRLTGPSP